MTFGLDFEKPILVEKHPMEEYKDKGDILHEWIVAKNKYNGNIYFATHQVTDQLDIEEIVRTFYHNKKNKFKRVLILSGTHGDEDGYSALHQVEHSQKKLIGLTKNELNNITFEYEKNSGIYEGNLNEKKF